MSRSRDDVPLSVKYEVAVLYADQVGDRQAAREIGVSTTSIGNWRQGKKHNRATAPKVERWFARSGRKLYETDTGEMDAFAALKALVGDVPRKRRKTAAHRIDAVVRDDYAAAPVPTPPWVGRFRKLIDTELR